MLKLTRALALIIAMVAIMLSLAACTGAKDEQAPTQTTLPPSATFAPTENNDTAATTPDNGDGIAAVEPSDEIVVYECADYKIVQRPYDYIGYLTSYDNGKSGADKRYGVARRTDEGTSFPITEALYDGIMDFTEGLCAVRTYNVMEGESKWGFIDETGAVIIDFKYDIVGGFLGGYSQVGIGKGNNVKYGLVDSSGREVLPPEYSNFYFDSGTIKNGYIDVSNKVDENNIPLFGKYDLTNGKLAAPMEYYELGDFSEGLCAVKGKTASKDPDYAFSYLWGYVNENGELAIPLQYNKSWDMSFREGLASVFTTRTEQTWMGDIEKETAIFIDKGGSQVGDYYAENREFSEGLAPVYGADDSGVYLWGYADLTGKLAIPYIFSNVNPFSDGFAVVWYKDGERLINKSGEFVGDFEMQGTLTASANEIFRAYPWIDGVKKIYCDVGEGSRYGIMDTDGKLTASGFVDTGAIGGGLIAVQKQKESKWGYISAATGETVIPYTLDYAGDFSSGVAFARSADTPKDTILQAAGLIYYPLCIINDKGERLTEYSYIGTVQDVNSGRIEKAQTIAPFKDGKAIVAVGNGEGVFSYVELEVIEK